MSVSVAIEVIVVIVVNVVILVFVVIVTTALQCSYDSEIKSQSLTHSVTRSSIELSWTAKKNSIDFHDMWKARNKIFSYLRPHLPFSSIPLLRIANRLLSSQLFPGNKLLKMLKNIEKKNIEKYSSQLISCN